MSDKGKPYYYIVCRNCTNKRDFEMVLQANNRNFSIRCKNCGEHVRTLPSFCMKEYMEAKYKNMAFPIGKYRGIIISTMVRKQDISFLLWYRESELWRSATEDLKNCIQRHLENYAWLKKDGKLAENDDERPEPITKKYPLDLFPKKFNEDHLPL
jgi:hypothetical protein